MKRIYLSGNMTPNTDHYFEWCKEFQQYMWSIEEYACSMPLDHHITDAQFIVRHDLARLKASDLVAVNLNVLDKSHHLTGVVVEIYEAYKQDKPVYTFGDCEHISEQANSPWISQFITRHFETMEDLMIFLQFDDTF
jgi:nucleoside 2-deoxyribosyltransferase